MLRPNWIKPDDTLGTLGGFQHASGKLPRVTIGVDTTWVNVSTAGATSLCRPGVVWSWARWAGLAGERRQERRMRTGAATLVLTPRTNPELAPVWSTVLVTMLPHADAYVLEAGAVCQEELGSTPAHPRIAEGVEIPKELDREVADCRGR